MQPVDSLLDPKAVVLYHRFTTYFPFTTFNQNTLILWLGITLIINNIVVINIIITL